MVPSPIRTSYVSPHLSCQVPLKAIFILWLLGVKLGFTSQEFTLLLLAPLSQLIFMKLWPFQNRKMQFMMNYKLLSKITLGI
ncbi:hypothetical protein V6Z11_A10G143600 [Gossypium hirsutum]